MSLMHAFLRVANQNLLAPGFRLLNRVVRPPRPVAVRVYDLRIYAASLDRLLALWMRRWTSAERFEAQLWQELLEPGMVVADVGANLGVYALLAARRVGPTGHVHAFEPDPHNFALLRRNISANGGEKIITAHQAAVSDQPGHITLYVRPEHQGDHRIYAPAGSKRLRVDVSATMLDTVFAEDPRVDVIKLDIQGAEWLAFAGLTRTLQNNPNVRIITEFWPEGLTQCGGDPRVFLTRWRDLGFDIQEIDDQRQRLVTSSDEELLERCRRIRYTNLFLVRS